VKSEVRSTTHDGASPAGTTAAPSLSQRALERIRDAIIYGRLDLGEPLSEGALARGLDMGKAPVRAAIHELRVKGLVRIVPNSGTYVFSPSREEVEQLCDFRTLLEIQALKCSMERTPGPLVEGLMQITSAMRRSEGERETGRRLDSAFHQLFITHCGNAYLADAYSTIGLQVEALRYSFMETTAFRQKAFAEHVELAALLADGRVGRAASVLAEHIARTRQFQATDTWSTGAPRRRDYKFREYVELFG